MNYMEMLKTVIHKINAFSKDQILVAIDGRCASGKSSFASALNENVHGELLHMDDFFLRKEQRTKARYETPGGNVDYERFEKEVLKPLLEKKKFLYRPLDCRTMSLTKGRYINSGGIFIIEGSYALHPSLSRYYDLKIFLTVDPYVQLQRIQKRNPDKVEDFRNKWIPLEEKYFENCHPENQADFIFNTTHMF